MPNNAGISLLVSIGAWRGFHIQTYKGNGWEDLAISVELGFLSVFLLTADLNNYLVQQFPQKKKWKIGDLALLDGVECFIDDLDGDMARIILKDTTNGDSFRVELDKLSHSQEK